MIPRPQRELLRARQPIILAVDEFWQTDRVPAFRDENNDHLKTIRKNEGAVLLATQSPRDALLSPNAHTLKQQVPTKIFFGDESASRADLVDGLGLTEAEFLAVTQVLPNMRHTFLMKRPGGSVLCRFDLSGAKDKIAVISGRRATYDLMNRLIARYGIDPAAWVPHFERMAPGVVDHLRLWPGSTETLPAGGGAGGESGATVTAAGGNTALDTMMAQSWGQTAASNATALGVNPSALAATCVLESNCSANVGGTGTISGAFQMSNGTYAETVAAVKSSNPASRHRLAARTIRQASLSRQRSI